MFEFVGDAYRSVCSFAAKCARRVPSECSRKCADKCADAGAQHSQAADGSKDAQPIRAQVPHKVGHEAPKHDQEYYTRPLLPPPEKMCAESGQLIA